MKPRKVLAGASILGGFLLGGILSQLALPVPEPTYSSRMTYLVSALPAEAAGGSDLTSSAYLSEQRADSYARLLTSRQVLEPVISGLHLDVSVDELADRIEVEVPYATSVIAATIEGSDPDLTVAIGRAISRTAPDALEEFDRPDPGSPARVEVVVLTDASMPMRSSNWQRWFGLGLGALIGAALGGALVRERQRFQARTFVPDDIVRAIPDLPLLGTIHQAMPNQVSWVSSALLASVEERVGPVLVMQTGRGGGFVGEYLARDFGRRGRCALVHLNEQSSLAQISAATRPEDSSQQSVLCIDLRTGAPLRPRDLKERLNHLTEDRDVVLVSASARVLSSQLAATLQICSAVVLVIPQGALISDVKFVVDLVSRAGAPVAGTIQSDDGEGRDRPSKVRQLSRFVASSR